MKIGRKVKSIINNFTGWVVFKTLKQWESYNINISSVLKVFINKNFKEITSYLK